MIRYLFFFSLDWWFIKLSISSVTGGRGNGVPSGRMGCEIAHRLGLLTDRLPKSDALLGRVMVSDIVCLTDGMATWKKS